MREWARLLRAKNVIRRSYPRLTNYLRTCWHRSCLVRFAAYVALGFWILLGDPFGISSATDRAIATEIREIGAIISPAAAPPVTVVAIDTTSIETLHADTGWMTANDWPLTYSDHKRIILELAKHGVGNERPSAIFYDIFFEKNRVTSGPMKPLGKTLSKLENAEEIPPIVFAGGGSHMSMSERAYSDLEEPMLATSSWQGYEDNYPLEARLWRSDASTGVGPDKNAQTPAAVLYQEWCADSQSACAWDNAENLQPLAPQWKLQAGHQCAPKDLVVRAWRLIERSLLGLVNGTFGLSEPSAKPSTCLPYRTVRLAELFGDTPKTLRPPDIAPDTPYVVLTGVVMPSLGDYVEVPLYGQIEGVYLHAAATSNLIHNGADYLEERDLSYWAIAIWIIAVVLFMDIAARNRRQQVTPRPPIVRFLLTSIVTIVPVVGLYWLFHHWIRVEPVDWLSLIAIVPALREVVARTEATIPPTP